MVGKTLVDAQRYAVPQDFGEGLASFDVANTIIRGIVPEIRKSRSEGIDISVEMHEYKTTSVEGKYTHGVYTKLNMITPQEPEDEADIDDDVILEVVERHLSDLNRQVVDLHNRVQSSLAELRALEKE